MDEESLIEWRKRRLEAFAKKAGGNKSAGQKLGYKDGAFVGQMIKGERPITEKTIAKIHSLSGFENWFLEVSGWPFEEVDFARWHRLTERQKGRVEKAVNNELDLIEAERTQANGTHG